MGVFGFTPRFVWLGLPLVGYAIGLFFDQQETLRMTNFRDKSKLYAGSKPADAPPSWP